MAVNHPLTPGATMTTEGTSLSSRETSVASDKTPIAHDYLSTACWHELNDGRPTLHAQCRATCKFGEGEPEYCSCPNHPAQDNKSAPLPWVDQARSIAVRLLEALGGPGGLAEADPALYREYRTDPAWFWMRGEVQPPGEWRPTSEGETK